MDIKEAFDTVINVLETECDKHANCSECIFYTDCEENTTFPYATLKYLRDTYFNSEKQKDSIRKNKELIDNPCYNRVYANKGDNVLCIDDGGSYTTYKDFFKQNGREDLMDKYKGWPLIVGKVYEVVDIYPHNDRTCNVYILKEKSKDDVVYLCTDDTDYIKRITDKCKWTDKSKQRVMKLLFEVGHLEEYNFMFVEGGYLLLSRSYEFGYTSEVMSNVPKMSSEAIKKKITSYVNSLH